MLGSLATYVSTYVDSFYLSFTDAGAYSMLKIATLMHEVQCSMVPKPTSPEPQLGTVPLRSCAGLVYKICTGPKGPKSQHGKLYSPGLYPDLDIKLQLNR